MNTEHTSSKSAPGAIRIILILCDICFFIALVSVFLSWLMNPFILKVGGLLDVTIGWGVKPFLGMAIFLILHLLLQRYFNAKGLWQQKWFQGVSLTTGVTIFTLIVVEFALANIPLQLDDTPPIVVKGFNKLNIPNTDTTVGDPLVRWRYQLGGTFWGLKVNKLGYLDREVSIEKPSGMVRVICMGDSVTSQAPPPYSRYLHDRLVKDPPDHRHWEAFNMGVVGYTSVQGLRVFQIQGKSLHPDYVTLYFGWNDHWISGLKPDSEIMVLPFTPWQAELAHILETKKLGKLVLNAWQSFRRRSVSREREGVAPWELNRVPADEFESTMKLFVEEIRSVGAVPILITAPRAEILTEGLVFNQQAKSVEDAITQHDHYVDLVRKVAAEKHVELLDLAAIMKGPDHAELFSNDGIHMTYPGLEFIAAQIDKKLRAIIKK